MKNAFYNTIIGIIGRLPKSLRRPIVSAVCCLRVKKARDLKTPTSLVFFVTNKCNARCRHCFYWKELNKISDELTLQQIRKTASSLKDSYGIVITGGEPFMRKDLYEICKSFDRRIKTLRIATNGMMTERICETVGRITEECNFKNIDIQVSIDGPRELHDMIRGVNGSFDSAVRTIRKLKELNKKGLNIEVVAAINKKNHGHIERLVKSITPLKVPVSFIITRSSNYGVYNLPRQISSEISTKEKRITNLSVKELKSAVKKLESLNRKSGYKFWPVENQLYLKYGINILDKRTKTLQCYAGSVDGTIYPNGDVALCELTKPVGNLKDYDYDFHRLWHSEKADKTRKMIKNCFCIHGCNLSTSISLSREFAGNTLLRRKK